MPNLLRTVLLALLALISSVAFAQRERLLPAEPMVARNSVGLSEWVGEFVYLASGQVLVSEEFLVKLSKDSELRNRFNGTMAFQDEYIDKPIGWSDTYYKTRVYSSEEARVYARYQDDCTCGIPSTPSTPSTFSQVAASRHPFLAKTELGGLSAAERGSTSKPFSGDGSL